MVESFMGKDVLPPKERGTNLTPKSVTHGWSKDLSMQQWDAKLERAFPYVKPKDPAANRTKRK